MTDLRYSLRVPRTHRGVALAAIFIVLMVTGATARPQLTENDISALLRDVVQNQQRMMGQYTEYTANYKSTIRRFDGKGKQKSETILEGETYQSSRRNVDVALRKNGQPLSEKKIAQEREQAVKALVRDSEERRKAGGQPEEAVAEYGVRFNGIYINTFTMMRGLAFFNPREEMLDGRRTIVLDFRPSPNFVPPSKEQAMLRNLCGTFWIDAADKVIAKLVARPTGAGQPDAVVFAQQNVRMPDGVWPNGLWIDRYTRVNPAANPALFGGMNSEWIHERGNHQRFGAKIEDVKIGQPTARP